MTIMYFKKCDFILCSVVYLTCTMALGALSVCLTVLVLNLHHRDNERPVPAWAQTLVLDYLGSVLCVTGNQYGAQDTQRVIAAAQENVEVCKLVSHRRIS